MFGSKKKTAVEEAPSEPYEVGRARTEAEALARVRAADARLVEATHELQKFVEQNFRFVGRSVIYVTQLSRTAADDQVRALVAAQDKARDEFHAALAAWSKFKKNGR